MALAAPRIKKVFVYFAGVCGRCTAAVKVCIQTFALLYIAAFPCIPNCLGIMSQLITGDYVIKFERKSFRFQLSARGIAICFASAQPKAQPKAQVRGGKWRCGLSLSLSAV